MNILLLQRPLAALALASRKDNDAHQTTIKQHLNGILKVFWHYPSVYSDKIEIHTVATA